MATISEKPGPWYPGMAILDHAVSGSAVYDSRSSDDPRSSSFDSCVPTSLQILLLGSLCIFCTCVLVNGGRRRCASLICGRRTIHRTCFVPGQSVN